jgi:DNA polymerase-3 subunit alpha (Gram-positive type)
MSEKYIIKPDLHKFRAFMSTMELGPEEKKLVSNLQISEVHLDEEAKTWDIYYTKGEVSDADAGYLDNVGKKLAAACALTRAAFLVKETPNIPDDICHSPAYLAACRQVVEEEGGYKTSGVIMGRKITKNPRTMQEVVEEENNVVVAGEIVGFRERELRTGAVIVTILVKDDTDGLLAKVRFGEGKNNNDLAKNKEEAAAFQKKMPVGSNITMQGNIMVDKYENSELIMMPVKSIVLMPKEEVTDKAPIKRVELHCHTKMSKMDGVTPIEELVRTAAKWGHKAIAITDHGVVQAFPFAYKEIKDKKLDIKLIYGVEGYLCHELTDKKNYHIIILVKNIEGLRNLYRLISLSHLQYFGGKPKRPRMTKALINQYREGLIIGSACAAGEVFRGLLAGVSQKELEEIASFYDYLEVQPLGNNRFLLNDEYYPEIKTKEDLENLNKKVIALADKLGKMTVATGDVHFLRPKDNLIRRILTVGIGYPDVEQPPLYFRTTEEMLTEFEYLGKDRAYEIVVTNPNKINDLVEKFEPVPDEKYLYSPVIPGAEQKVKDMSYARAHELYGEKLPKIVEDRLKLELDAIIGNGFAVLYYIAHLLVKKSNDDGYMVGSRGSVGSSFVATMLNITEVNPLAPHYRCPHCYHTEFIEDGSVGSGFDLPVKLCPECHKEMVRDGHGIPFAVFLGFHGDKVPDIDLNFSGEYQSKAHKYTEELFGRDNVFRAGTLGTIAAATAYGYVKKYFEGRNQPVRSAFIEGLIPGLVDVKRTTGQHPGGIVVVPRDLDIHYITPVSYPADDENCGTITTHFDYHSINDRLVKLDILGHDDPTMIKMLDTLLGQDGYCKKIPFGDPDTMELFLSTKSLGVKPEDIGTNVGTYGVPECGTFFVRQMIEDVKPKNFSDLLHISGYSHGTDVWLNNAQDLIKKGTKTEDTISTRDDIMNYLINKGVEPSMAFGIMEWCRKGKAHKKGLKPEQKEAMAKAHIPDFYVRSCQTVQYLFPKAHAVAYVMSAYRIAYCKVHHPKEFYAAYFSIRTPKFDYALVSKGEAFMKRFIKDVYTQGNKASANDKDTVTYMEVAVEMMERGFKFSNIHWGRVYHWGRVQVVRLVRMHQLYHLYPSPVVHRWSSHKPRYHRHRIQHLQRCHRLRHL